NVIAHREGGSKVEPAVEVEVGCGYRRRAVDPEAQEAAEAARAISQEDRGGGRREAVSRSGDVGLAVTIEVADSDAAGRAAGAEHGRRAEAAAAVVDQHRDAAVTARRDEVGLAVAVEITHCDGQRRVN